MCAEWNEVSQKIIRPIVWLFVPFYLQIKHSFQYTSVRRMMLGLHWGFSYKPDCLMIFVWRFNWMILKWGWYNSFEVYLAEFNCKTSLKIRKSVNNHALFIENSLNNNFIAEREYCRNKLVRISKKGSAPQLQKWNIRSVQRILNWNGFYCSQWALTALVMASLIDRYSRSKSKFTLIINIFPHYFFFLLES